MRSRSGQHFSSFCLVDWFWSFVGFLVLFCFLIANFLGMETGREEKISKKSTLKFRGRHKRWEKFSMGGKKTKVFPRQVQNINRFPWIFQNVTFLPANYTKIPVCKGEAGKGGVECPQKGGKLSSHGCHRLSQKDVCCSPVSLFAGKPRGKKETKLLWVFPTYLNFLLSPFSRLALGSACPLGDPRCPKPLPSSSWMAGESPGTCPPCAPPSCGQPHLVQQKWEKCCFSVPLFPVRNAGEK